MRNYSGGLDVIMAGQAELAGKLLHRGMQLVDAHRELAAISELRLEVRQLRAGLILDLQLGKGAN